MSIGKYYRVITMPVNGVVEIENYEHSFEGYRYIRGLLEEALKDEGIAYMDIMLMVEDHEHWKATGKPYRIEKDAMYACAGFDTYIDCIS